MASDSPCPVPIAEIVRDPRWYPRDRVPQQRVARCAEIYAAGGPEALPPIVLGKLPHSPERLLVHGWQRVAGAEMAGLDALPAITYSFCDGWEILAAAVRAANLLEAKDPRPLTPGEKGRCVDVFLKQFPATPPTKLATRLGVTREYVWKRRLLLTEGRAAADPLGKLSRLLVKTAAELHAQHLRPPEDGSDERRQAVIAALAQAAATRHDQEAGLWLQHLEALARDAARLLADLRAER